MNTILQDIKEISLNYRKHLEKTNPQFEFWRYEAEKEGHPGLFYSDRASDYSFLNKNMCRYREIVKLLEDNKNSIHHWHRFIYLDSFNQYIFVTFVIEEGELRGPFFLFEAEGLTLDTSSDSDRS